MTRTNSRYRPTDQDVPTKCASVHESGRPDSNRQRLAWKASALPLSYTRDRNSFGKNELQTNRSPPESPFSLGLRPTEPGKRPGRLGSLPRTAKHDKPLWLKVPSAVERADGLRELARPGKRGLACPLLPCWMGRRRCRVSRTPRTNGVMWDSAPPAASARRLTRAPPLLDHPTPAIIIEV